MNSFPAGFELFGLRPSDEVHLLAVWSWAWGLGRDEGDREDDFMLTTVDYVYSLLLLPFLCLLLILIVLCDLFFGYILDLFYGMLHWS